MIVVSEEEEMPREWTQQMIRSPVHSNPAGQASANDGEHGLSPGIFSVLSGTAIAWTSSVMVVLDPFPSGKSLRLDVRMVWTMIYGHGHGQDCLPS
jgi:hypothetical protein